MGQQQAYVIIGNGITGITAAEILRAEDPACSITIIADDPFPVYYRPALKDFLGGHLPEEKLWARPTTFYRDQRIRFILGRVIGINTTQHCVQLHNGKHITYSKLLLANGARPRHLSCPGLNLAGVSTLRTVADYQEILRRLGNVTRVVVYGSGTLALESAETLRHRGCEVTHLMRGNTLWSEVLDPIASDLVLQEELRDGINVRTGAEIAEIVGKHGQVTGVTTTQGEHIPCTLVLIAIGIEPIIDFIRASGIVCGRGVQVDNGMRTNVPDIYAAGDVIETTDKLTGRTRVLGQWFPAIQQAQFAAYNMLGILPHNHPFHPGSNSEARAAYMNYYNATFLYGLDFASIGLTTPPSSPGYQEVLADPQPRSHRKVILRNGTIVGALLLGERTHALAFKRAIDHRVHLAPIASQLFAVDFDLDAWLDQQRIPGPVLNFKEEGVSYVQSTGVPLNSPLSEQAALVVGLEHRREVQQLGDERIQFEIDMCIGCDRCMHACPVPISSQVTIAELNHATTSARVAPHVARFTHECIMCGSCVPVCPVDNHRDLLMLSLKERLGVSWNSTPHLHRVADVLPVGWTLAALISGLREQPILRDPQQVPDTYLLHMLAASRQRILSPGETVICEGEYGRDLYLILDGLLELTATTIDNTELPVALLRRGEYAGEDGMLTGQPYKASARAQTPALLLQVPEQVMQRLMELVPSVRKHFESCNNAHSLQSILKRMALFQGVADADIQALMRQTPVQQYERNKPLFTEDNRGRPARETLHILLEGFVKVARHTQAGTRQHNSDERIVAYRQGGDYFAGGLDLLGDGQAVTVTTINRCRVAEVPRHALLALFQQYPEVERRFSVRLREYIATSVATQSYRLSKGVLQYFTAVAGPVDRNVQAGLHALISDGVVEGTEVLVIDLDKCIHCDECEEA